MPESEDHLSTRKEEILTLSYIYDELHISVDELSGSLVIPVELEHHIRIKCTREEQVRFLPGITLTFATSEMYPESEPPAIALECCWLSTQKLRQVEDDARQIWETSKELCLYNIIDEITGWAKNIFGLEMLRLSQTAFEDAILFAQKEEERRFEEGAYFCGVCLEYRKGTECFKLSRCGHIFCRECLRDYYGMCITEGLVNQVVCCDTTCAKSLKAPPDPKTPEDHAIIPFLNALCLVPSTLAQIFPNDPTLISRYIRLIKQKYYETAGETIYCPLEHCQAPIIPSDKESKVVVCTKCRYPFCRLCRSSWHGAGAGCKIQNGIVEKFLEASEEEKRRMQIMYGVKVLNKLVAAWQAEAANRGYLKENTTACPTCGVSVQKSSGCNKMVCFSCRTYFCYLCGSYLDPLKPYVHFWADGIGKKTSCEGMLFAGIQDDGQWNQDLREGRENDVVDLLLGNDDEDEDANF